jgi:hypothetical protein
MTYEQQREHLLQQMNSLTHMERGKLCRQSRGPGATPFYKLQCWQRGKNHTRYVPADQVPALQEALANHQQFQELAEAFVTLTVRQTRQAAAADGKKNSMRSRPSATAKPKPS